MMRYRTGLLALVVLVLVSVAPSGFAMPEGPDDGVTVFIASDLHYLSPRLGAEGAAYETAAEPRDGKAIRYIEAIVDAFVDQVIAEKPDMLILSGDLTFNGERYSHEDLAKKLRRIDPAVTKVCVIPGNHDINNVFAFRFEGGSAYEADFVSPAQFAEIYDSLGITAERYGTTQWLGYVAQAADGPWFMLLDSCRYQNNIRQGYPSANGWVDDALFPWMEHMAAKAREAGKPVVTVMHHNLLVHNPEIRTNYAVENNRAMLDLLRRNGIRLNLSGHIHVQDIQEYEGIYDIASGALSVYPHLYGVLRYADGVIDYRAQKLDVAGWAAAHGATDPNLLRYDAYARGRLNEALGNMGSRIAAEKFTDAQVSEMRALIGELNAMYFAGESVNESEYTCQHAYKLIQGNGGSLLRYVDFIIRYDGMDDRRLVIQ